MSLNKSNNSLGSRFHPKSSLENPWKFHNQDYEMLKKFHLEKETLFTDEYFSANMNSIGLRLKNEFDTSKIIWKRPKDICKEPCFTVDGISFTDIVQRRLGNCWVLSAIGSVTLKHEALAKIIPENQGFGKPYAGIFHFRLWHLGEWMDIVIDDRLPFLDGKYLSVQPSCENEFWPCLLEKAYAKFLGSYENLHWGDPAGAFVNLTGGLTMTLDLKSTKVDTYWNMIRMASRDTLMACISNKQDPTSKNQHLRPRFHAGNNIIKNNRPQQRRLDVVTEDFHTNNVAESRQRIFVKTRRRPSQMDKIRENVLQENGLVERHAYSITDCAEVPFRKQIVKLIRLWNPWGSGEWNGNWNDRCPLWKEVSEKDRRKLQKINDDGEFWMCWEDFINTFSKLIFCNQVPDFFDWEHKHKRWSKKMFRSRWTKENLSWKHIDKDFLNKNPLYIITVTGSDEGKSGVNVVASLMQSTRNRHKYGDWLPIGFIMFEFPGSQDKIPDSLLTPENRSKIKSCRKYNITEAYELKPGRYGLIPYTMQKDHESSFFFQIFLNGADCTGDINLQQSPKGAGIPKHERIFKLYATKGSTLYAWDLQRLLNNELKEFLHPVNARFSTDGCREILASIDTSRKGKLDVGTFLDLWEIITQYKDLFSRMDANRCGYIGLPGLCKIIKQAGLNVHNDLLQQLFARYSNAQEKLSFVDYLVCTVRLKGFMKTFYKLSADGKVANINFDKWLQLMM